MKIFKHLLLAFAFLLLPFTVKSQELTIEIFEPALFDNSAAEHVRKDLNNNDCALIKIAFPMEGAIFEGNIVGGCEYKNREYRVYVTGGTKMLRIKHPDFRPLTVNTADFPGLAIEKGKTYVMALNRAGSNESFLPDSDNELRETLLNYLDNDKFKDCFDKAMANSNNPVAANFLGIIYEDGYLGEKNFKEAFKWYSRAAEQGYLPAQTNLGIMYNEGKGTEKDMNQALRWYASAAQRGNEAAQTHLGLCYEEGLGVSRDNDEAFKWTKRAAEKGMPEAQNSLAFMYMEGMGTAANPKEAVRWCRKAAEQDYDDAQFNLGMCYLNGTGIPENYREGLRWIRKAAAQGYEDAVALLKELGEEP